MKKTITIIVILVILVAAYFGYRAFQQRQNALALTNELETVAVERGNLDAVIDATGVVRTNQSAALTWDISGHVGTVNVELGDQVTAGQVLAELEQLSLPQNMILARSDLVNAQKALDDLLNSQLPQAQALQTVEDAQKALDDYTINFALEQAQAQLDLANAQDALHDAELQWQVQQQGSRASSSTLDATRADLTLADLELENAQTKYNEVANRPEDDPMRAVALSNLAAAQKKYDGIMRQLNWYTGAPTEIDQAMMQAAIVDAQAQLAKAESEWNRLLDGPDPAELALLEAQLEDAQREWERLKDGPDPDDIAAAEAKIASIKATLAQTKITAPFDGVITKANSKPGDPVNPNTMAFQVDDLSHLLVDLEVSEIDITQIEVGQDVSLTFDAILGKEYHGKVVEVAMVGTDQSGVVNFGVTVEMTNADEDVKPGMTSAVYIVTYHIEDVLLVPNRSIRTVEGDRVVYLVTDMPTSTATQEDTSTNPRQQLISNLTGADSILMNTRPVVITTGASSDTHTQVIAGDLKAGDMILLNPPSNLDFNVGPGGGGFMGR